MVGTVVKQYRLKFELEQAELAELLHISQPQMSRIESGLVALTKEQLFYLADYFSAPDILLAYIQPYLDRAVDMTCCGANQPVDKYLIPLLREVLADIETAVAADDSESAVMAASKLTAFAQIVRVLVSL